MVKWQIYCHGQKEPGSLPLNLFDTFLGGVVFATMCQTFPRKKKAAGLSHLCVEILDIGGV